MDNRIVLPVGETMGTSWDKTYGAKASFWAAFGIFFLIMVGFGILRMVAEHLPSESAAIFVGGIIGLIGQIIQVLMQYGLYYMGIRRAADLPIRYDMMFYTFSWGMLGNIILLLLIISFVIYLPAGLFVAACYFIAVKTGMMSVLWVGGVIAFLLFFYIAIRVSLCLGFLFDGAGPWESIKLSWHVTKDNVIPIAALIIVSMVLIALSAIPLGIGLIWTLPWAFVLYGLMYQRLKMNANPVVVTTPTSPV